MAGNIGKEMARKGFGNLAAVIDAVRRGDYIPTESEMKSIEKYIEEVGHGNS